MTIALAWLAGGHEENGGRQPGQAQCNTALPWRRCQLRSSSAGWTVGFHLHDAALVAEIVVIGGVPGFPAGIGERLALYDGLASQLILDLAATTCRACPVTSEAIARRLAWHPGRGC